MRSFLLVVLMLSALPNVWAKAPNFKVKESMLAAMVQEVAREQDTVEKRRLNEAFRQVFEEVLQMEGAVKYPFKNVPYLYLVESPDKRLRIISWGVPLERNHFYGFAMLRKGRFSKESQLIVLNEMSTQPALSKQKTLSPDQWAGALYTKVLQHRDKKSDRTYYTLLGLRLVDGNYGSKIIDVATIAGDTLSFGAPIFNQRNHKQFRVVFEYNPQVTMRLEYNKKLKKIVFTTLVPPPDMPRMSRHQQYLPADSYDAFVWDEAYWSFEENVKLPIEITGGRYVQPSSGPE